MAKNKVYINSVSHISAQQPLSDSWLDSPVVLNGQFFYATDPDYKGYISPAMARRLTPILKRALVTASEAMKCLPEEEQAQAIITGTGLGSMASTDKIINAMMAEGENFSQPTHFMQSTHNSMGSTVAIARHCHAYNATYSQNGVSAECAFLDAFLQMNLGHIANALVCAHDELSPRWSRLQPGNSPSYTPPQVPFSEASAAFLLSTKRDNALCEIVDLNVCYGQSFETMLANLAAQNDISTIDALMLSCTGENDYDSHYATLVGSLNDVPVLHYKHLFGESLSSSAMGIYTSALCLDRGEAPAILSRHPSSTSVPVKTILFANYDRLNCSLMLIKSC